ncbi:Asp-tRNA(Asn)/Glu-tRNA(Gln) amidotransferase subunit GatC [Patescibacteria group bacterium]|nr:Asp-tRNA(Asn)/Glu-tRNA(Gln) amidotransferase subunit GatC [Patescibacteria group bacterium]
MINKDQVKHIAKLTRLKLTEEKVNKYQKDLTKILHYVGQLQEIDTKNIPPCSGGTDLKNVFREDESGTRIWEESQKLVDQAPSKQKDLIKTKGVFIES